MHSGVGNKAQAVANLPLETEANHRTRPPARRSLAEKALIALEVFVALTAGGGGIALIAGLEGARFPHELLRGTPFSSYLIPGLILMSVVGGSAGIAAVVLLRNRSAGAVASVLAGAILMGWIAGEVLLLRQPSWVEAFFFAVGLTLAWLALLTRGGLGHALGTGGT